MTMVGKKRVSRNKELIPSNIFNYIFLVATYEQSQSKDYININNVRYRLTKNQTYRFMNSMVCTSIITP